MINENRTCQYCGRPETAIGRQYDVTGRDGLVCKDCSAPGQPLRPIEEPKEDLKGNGGRNE